MEMNEPPIWFLSQSSRTMCQIQCPIPEFGTREREREREREELWVELKLLFCPSHAARTTYATPTDDEEGKLLISISQQRHVPTDRTPRNELAGGRFVAIISG